jgi:leucine-rich repeat transmembrane neuronal protein 1/2
VEFTADTLKLNLIDLGRTESKLITVAGHVDFMCQEVEAADPVTFTTRDSNLVSLVSAPLRFRHYNEYMSSCSAKNNSMA